MVPELSREGEGEEGAPLRRMTDEELYALLEKLRDRVKRLYEDQGRSGGE
jgi:hypothetical protein